MRIFGINGIHTTEACPLNNLESAKAVIQMSLKSGGKEVKEGTKSIELLVNITRL